MHDALNILFTEGFRSQSFGENRKCEDKPVRSSKWSSELALD